MMCGRIDGGASLAQAIGAALLFLLGALPTWGCAPYPGREAGGSEVAAAAGERAGSSPSRTRAPEGEALPPGLPPQAPGSLLLGGPYVRAERSASAGSALASGEDGFRIEEGDGVVLWIRARYDDPRLIDEEQWEDLAVWIPSADKGAGRKVSAADLAYTRSTAWVKGLYASTGGSGWVEILEAGESGLMVRLDLEIEVRGSPGQKRFPVKATLPFRPVCREESRRR
jgi:hypothetical protein